MARDWEAQLATWVKPASDSEEQRRARTEKAITQAINAVPEIADYPINVYSKGSFANRTNVRLDSDVDVTVEYTGLYYMSFDHDVADLDRESAGIERADHDYDHKVFRTDIENALVAAFGRSAVTRGNKAIALREEENHLAADVVPCYTYRRYYGRSGGRLLSHLGTQIHPDTGLPIENWPQQHYDNGVSKNTATGQRFKGMVRALKNLENEMVEAGVAKEVPSYLIECIVYNVPNGYFGSTRLGADLQNVLAWAFNNSRSKAECFEWVEVNELKWLFRGQQKWTWEHAHAFIAAAWDYMGFE